MSGYTNPHLLRYFSEISRAKIPNAKEERMLFMRYHVHGDLEARRLLIEGGIRFVITIARRYDRGDENFLHNLIAAGNVGLMLAIDKYRPWMIRCPRCKKNNYVAKPKRQRCKHCKRALRYTDAQHYATRFLTYAAWWITESIRAALYTSSPIHIPPYKQKEHHRVRQTGENVGFMYVSFEEAMTSTTIQRYVDRDTHTVHNGENHYAEQHTRKFLYKLLRTLKDRQAYVVIAYYGLREERKTLREIANKLGVCSERVRQIKKDALEKMKINLQQQQIASTVDVY